MWGSIGEVGAERKRLPEHGQERNKSSGHCIAIARRRRSISSMSTSRHRSSARALTAAVALTFVALPLYGQKASSAVPAGCSVGNARAGTSVLVFSRTTGFRHASIPDGIAAIRKLGTTRGFVGEATEDP